MRDKTGMRKMQGDKTRARHAAPKEGFGADGQLEASGRVGLRCIVS